MPGYSYLDIDNQLFMFCWSYIFSGFFGYYWTWAQLKRLFDQNIISNTLIKQIHTIWILAFSPKAIFMVILLLFTVGNIHSQSLCTGANACTKTLTGASGDYVAWADGSNPRICIAGTVGAPYTGQITNIGDVGNVWVCVTGYWTPTTTLDYSGSNGNLLKLDVTGTLTPPGLLLWSTAVTNKGTIHVTGSNKDLQMDLNNQGASLTNTGTIVIDNGDLKGPQGGTGFIDNSGTITLSGSGKKVNLDGYNGTTAFMNQAAGTIKVNGDFRMVSNGGASNIYNYGVISTLGTGAGTGKFYSDNETATSSAFYNYGKIKTYDFALTNSALDFYNYCWIDVTHNFTSNTVSAGGVWGPTTASGYIGKITVAGTSTYTAGGFIPAGQELDFCDAGSPAGGWDGTDPAAGGWTRCTRAVVGNAACSNFVLPVELMHFSVGCSGNNDGEIAFEWLTATEINNDYFTIEKSTDGRFFEEVLNVKGAGNSSRKINYATKIAYESQEKPVYYRLKQTDYNGAYSYSQSVSFQGCGKEFYVRVLNNGNSDGKNIMIDINSKDNVLLSLSLYDAAGRLIEYRDRVVANNNVIEFNTVASGMYFLQIAGANSNYVEKIIVR